jgi:hypothetical protein
MRQRGRFEVRKHLARFIAAGQMFFHHRFLVSEVTMFTLVEQSESVSVSLFSWTTLAR